MTIYLELTKKFNKDKLRAVITSGQAVVLHRLAIMSKDGDWILKEDEESLNYVLNVLSELGAKYRFGAPLNLAWLSVGWSSHFEFISNNRRIRTDFFTRPPRIPEVELKMLWNKSSELPVVDLINLALTKQTMRMKDYAVIGELARKIAQPELQLQFSRSARDIVRLKSEFPIAFESAAQKRPVLILAKQGLEVLERGILDEQLQLMKQDEARLVKYSHASLIWQEKWPQILTKIKNLNLLDAHAIISAEANKFLPTRV